MKVFIATDHAGYEFKNQIKEYLSANGYDIEDCGAYEYDKDDDYPDFISIAAGKVSKNPGTFGIVLGKSGAGECIVANKIKGIRAVLGVSEKNARLAREHNDANVLSLGSDIVDLDTAKKIVEIFLTTEFTQEERHIRRIDKIAEIENKSI